MTDPPWLGSATEKAQRWHDTDHGPCEWGGYSHCWCCCTACDPANPEHRHNPYWNDAERAIRAALIR